MQTFSVALKKLSLLAIALAVIPASCAKTTGTVATNSAVCDVWQPIGWSKKDTDLTTIAVKVNNARRNGWCNL